MEAPREKTAVITTLPNPNEFPSRMVLKPGEERLGYEIDPSDAPGCLKVYFGRKTVIIPLRNLISLELDL